MRWFLPLIFLNTPAIGASAVMEGIASNRQAIYVDTVNARVDLSTQSYGGGIANVGVFSSSNAVISNIGAANNCVIYATGSVTCLAQTLGNVVLSTETTLPVDTTFTNTTASCPIAGSTVTFSIPSASNLEFIFSGSISNSAGGSITSLSVLLDGGFIGALTGAKAVVIEREPGATSLLYAPASFHVKTRATAAAGSHSACLAAWVNGGTGTLYCSSSACQFEMRTAP